MLKLVLGGSGSGKTTLLYARIKARAEAGQRSILLVPEQFTSSTEGRIYRELGDALSGMVDSYSFTSLAEHILSAEGGAAVQTLSDAGRAVLVRAAGHGAVLLPPPAQCGLLPDGGGDHRRAEKCRPFGAAAVPAGPGVRLRQRQAHRAGIDPAGL